MKQILMLLTLGFLLFSCSSNDEESNENDNYFFTKLPGFPPGFPSDSYIYFDYNNNKQLIKKNWKVFGITQSRFTFFS